MTRCSDLCLLAAVALSSPAGAEGLVSDAFGLFDPAQDAARRTWAGQQGHSDMVAPGVPDRILIYSGPKSLIAGSDPGQVAAVVVDSLGNMVADDTRVTLTVGGNATMVAAQGGLASLVFTPDPVAGDILLGAASGGRQSVRATITVVADIGSIKPALEGRLPEAQPETLFEILSEPLTDAYGNALTDGTATSLLLRHPDDSYSLAFGVTLQDRATASFIARDIAGAGSATLVIGGAQSASKALTVATATAPVPPELALTSLTDLSALRVTLGPFVTTKGYVLADGAQVDLEVRLKDGSVVGEKAWLLDGEAAVLLPVGSADEVSVVTLTSPLGVIDLTEGWHLAADRLSPGEGGGE